MDMRRSFSWMIGLVALAGVVNAGPTGASRNVGATLVADVTAVQPGKPFRVGVLLRMAPEWHTYWRNPGDSGLPTKIAWTLPCRVPCPPCRVPCPPCRVPCPPCRCRNLCAAR